MIYYCLPFLCFFVASIKVINIKGITPIISLLLRAIFLYYLCFVSLRWECVGTVYLCYKYGFKSQYYERLIMTIVVSKVYKIINKDKADYYQLESLGLRSGMILARKFIQK